MQFLLVLNVKTKPQRIFEMFGGTVGHSRFLPVPLQLIEPVNKRFTATFTQRGDRKIQQLLKLPYAGFFESFDHLGEILRDEVER